MELSDLVEQTIKQAEDKRVTEQSRRIADASRMFDDMVQKGWIEAPSYKLAPISTLPVHVPDRHKLR